MVLILPGKIRSNYKKSVGSLQVAALKPCTNSRDVVYTTSENRKNMWSVVVGDLSKNEARVAEAA